MHRNSAGFLAIPIAAYAALGAALVIGVLGLWGYVEKSRYDALKAEYEQFKGGVEALGLAAKKAAAEKETADIKRKADTDDLHRKAVDALTADNRRLRNERAGRGFVSKAPTNSTSPGTATFDRAQLESALQQLDGAVQDLITEGDEARVGLDAAKSWARP